MDVQKNREELIRLARHKPELAAEHASSLVAQWPDEAWTWSLRSYIYEKMGKFDEALSDINEAIEINFAEPANYFEKALILVKLKEYHEAIDEFSRVINAGEKLSFKYYESTSYLMRAFCLCKIGDFSSAQADLIPLEVDAQAWIDRLRSRTELLEACRIQQID